jgi:hypothetical protein
MILEGLVTTRGPDGQPHLAPMGPKVDGPEFDRLLLRPFPTSQTCQNLLAHPEGVFHVTDDVLLLARAAIGRVDSLPALRPATSIRGDILVDCCRCFEFHIVNVDRSQQRVAFDAEIVARGRLRDFFGLNRAKHAVVEAAILATRVAIIPAAEIQDAIARLAPLVEKTGGPAECEAFALLHSYIAERIGLAQ